MRRLRRALLVLGSAIGVLALAAIVVYFTMRTQVARYVIERQLRRAGVSDASFHIRRVSLREIEVGDIEIRQPAYGSATRVSATYSWSSLLRSRLHSLTMHGGEVHLQRHATSDATAAPDVDLQLPFDVPLDQLTWRDTAIVTPGDSGERRFIVNGSLRRVSANTFHLDLDMVGDQQAIFRRDGLEVSGLVLQARLSIRSGRRDVIVTAREGNVVGFDRVSLASESTTFDSSAIRLVIDQSQGQPLARLRRGGAGASLEVAAECKSPSAITLAGNRGHLFVPALSASLQLERDAAGKIMARLDVGVQGASLRAVQFGSLAVVGLNAVIPIDFNVPAARRGPIAADAIVWRGARFDQFTGSLGMADGFLDADIEGSLGGGARLIINAGFDFSSGIAADIAAFIPPFQLSDAENIRRILPQLREAQIGGAYTMDAQVLLRDGVVDPYVHVKATNARIYNTRWPLAIDSADAEVVFTSLWPLRTPPGQRLTIRQARAGKLEVDSGEVSFQVRDAGQVAIDDLRWSMGPYGRFSASPFTAVLLQPKFDATVTAARVGLGAWLELLTDGRATSDGNLAGTLALHIDGERNQPVRVISGHLEGEPGEGNVAVEDARMLSRFLDRTASQAIAQEQWELVRTRLVDALADYHYTMLQVDFLTEQDVDRPDVLCRIQTSGRGRTGENPQELGLLTINLRNFNDLLNQVMLFRSALGGRE